MPRNGSGTYALPLAPVTADTTIDVAWANPTMADVATALTGSMARDGQSPPTANLPMGGYKHTGLGDGTALTDSVNLGQLYAIGGPLTDVCNFRLTLTTAVPVTTSDVTAATTLYAAPYKGNRIALFDGTNWFIYTSAQFSIAVPAAASQMYDVFCYANATVPTLELLAWTNDTTRATALTTQDGVLVKTGDATRRYLGSFRTTAVAGQTEDSAAKRFVWNYCNRVPRLMRVLEATDNWNYTTFTIRQANGAAANQLAMVVGVSEDVAEANILAAFQNSNAGVQVSVGVGVDTTSAYTTGNVNGYQQASVAGSVLQIQAMWRGYPGVGYHFLSWNECSSATGTTTWYGDANSAAQIQTGIYGRVMA